MMQIADFFSSGSVASVLFLSMIKASLVLAIAQLIISAAPRLSAASRHLLLVAGLSAFIVMPLLSFSVPAWTVPQLPNLTRLLHLPTIEFKEEASPEAAASLPALSSSQELNQVSSNDPISPSTEVTVTAPRSQVGRVAVPSATIRGRIAMWLEAILFGWLVIVLIIIGRLAVGAMRVAWLIRHCRPASGRIALLLEEAKTKVGLDRELAVMYGEDVSMPMVSGSRRAVLLLPAGAASWSDERLEAVILHELAHLQRWDYLWLAVTNLVFAIYWFHPQVWAARRRALAECERACDDLVLGSGTRASDYASHLLAVARLMPHRDRFSSMTLAMSHRSQLEGRLLSILAPYIRRGTIGGRTSLIAIVASIFLLAPLAAVRVGAETPQAQAHSVVYAVNHAVANGVAGGVAGGISDGVRQGVSNGVRDGVSNGVRDAVSEAVADGVDGVVNGIDLAKNGEKHEDDGSEPTSGSGWYSRGMQLLRKDRFDDSIAAFHKALDIGYRTEASTYNIACGYAQKGDTSQAISWLQKAAASGFDISDYLRDDSDLDPIRRDPAFRALLDRYPSDDGDKDRLSEAEDHYSALSKASSHDGEKWARTGLELLELREIDRAIDALTRASNDLQYRGHTAMYNLACAYSLKGDRAKGMEWLEKAIVNGFQNDVIRTDSDIANLREAPGFDRLLSMEQDLSLDQNWGGDWKDWKTLKKIANYAVFNDRDRWKDEIPRYQEMAQKYPSVGRAWFNLGFALHSAGQFGDAIPKFQEAIKLGYAVPLTSFDIACAYSRLDQKDNALQWLERAGAAGFDLENHRDRDLDNIEDDSRYEALVHKYSKDDNSDDSY